jgi:xanthine dehydrogenase large subunit
MKRYAREAEKLIEVEYEELKAITNLRDAISHGEMIADPKKIECGDADKAFLSSDNIIEDIFESGAQEHFYLETQSCLCIPGEGDEMNVLSSTQHPSETQTIVSEILGISNNQVKVEVKRLGGAFGGKETQANHFAAWCALLAKKTGRPVKIVLMRDDDQIMTGKRHPFLSKYKVGFDNEGKINALEIELNCDAGASTDLSLAILSRAMFHVDNSYFIPNMKVTGKAWKTNLPSNTAFRGFGAPQGIAVIENIVDSIARKLNKDPYDVRMINYYGTENNNITHYGEVVERNRLPVLIEQISLSSDYKDRRQKIKEFNDSNDYYKKGIALTPVKFGISFTSAFLNQAGALVNIYKDGTVLVNHGGVDMGQGLHAKIRKIASAEFGIDEALIRVSATDTSKVPNTSATAASSGTDLNGMAVKNAISKLKIRLSEIAADSFNKDETKNPTLATDIIFKDNKVTDIRNKKRRIDFEGLISLAYRERISLSATGFYRTPDIYFDQEKGKGRPFHYFAFGVSVSEVMVDILTGDHKIIRTDILHDSGDSIDEEIDKGQITGAFVQGLGWCTNEEIKHDDKGKLLSYSPDTYKIPGVRDIPDDFRVELMKNVPNPNVIRKSKAIGEPPFMHAFSVWLAIKDAVAAVGNNKIEPEYSIPATKEVILMSVEDIKKNLKI